MQMPYCRPARRTQPGTVEQMARENTPMKGFMRSRSNVTKYYLLRAATSALFFVPIMTIFYRQAGLSFAQIFMIQSWYTFISVAIDIPTSGLADLLRRKTTMLAATASYVAGFLIYYMAPGIGWFMLAESFLGFAVAMLSGVASAFVYDSLLEENREKQDKVVFGRASSIMLATTAVSSIVGSVVAEHMGIRVPLLLTALAYAVACVVVISTREPRRSKQTEGISRSKYFRQLREGFGIVLRDKTLFALAVDVAVFGGLLRVAYWYVQPRLLNVGIPVALFGVIFASMNLTAALVVNRAPWIDKRLGSTRTIILLRVVGLCAIAVLAAPTVWLPGAAAVVLVCTMHLRGALYHAYFNRLLPSSHRATALSYIAVLSSLAYFAMGPLVGQLSDLFGIRVVLLAAVAVTAPATIVKKGLRRAELEENQ